MSGPTRRGDRRREDVRRLLVVVVLAVAAGGCGPGAPSPARTAAGGTGGSDAALPRCGKPPSPAPDPPPPGAVLPPSTTLTAVREQPDATQLNAYVELTPAQVRDWIADDAGLKITASEDTGDELELLVTGAEHTTLVTVRAVCATASTLAELIRPAP